MPGQISARELQRMVEQDSAQVVEVLPQEDFDYEHIAGAVNLPLKELGPATAERLDRRRPIIVYCNDFL